MSDAELLRVVLALCFTVVLLLALAWLARRAGWLRRESRQAGLRILETRRLGPRSSLMLIEVEDARLVVGISAQTIALLHTLPASPQGAAPAGTPEFPSALGQARSRS